VENLSRFSTVWIGPDQSRRVKDSPFKRKFRVHIQDAEEKNLLTVETVELIDVKHLPLTHFQALIPREDPTIEPNSRFITKINFKTSEPEKDPRTRAVLLAIDGSGTPSQIYENLAKLHWTPEASKGTGKAPTRVDWKRSSEWFCTLVYSDEKIFATNSEQRSQAIKVRMLPLLARKRLDQD
jgi:hypothetical protein